MDVRLDGKVAIVTGGGGGLGRAFCSGLASAGARVAVADVRIEAARDVAAAIRDEGGQAEAIQVDVTSSSDVQRMADEVTDRLGGLDILVNNAGGSIHHEIKDMPEEDWDRVVDLNLKGVFLCSRAAIPRLIDRGGGRIINIASNLAPLGRAGNAPYVAAKAGVIGFTKSLAQELVSHRITVNCLAPAGTDTPLFRRALTAEQMEERLRTGQIASPEDLVPLLLLLASDLGRLYTGWVLVHEQYMQR